MEGVRAFLESSSISGLNHISTTKKCARAFWIVVVLAAIIMSGLLIFESFESYHMQSRLSRNQVSNAVKLIKLITQCNTTNNECNTLCHARNSKNVVSRRTQYS